MVEEKTPEEKSAEATTPPPPSVPAEKASAKAVTSLVLGILGILCCGLLAPIAWILGAQERKAIAGGKSSPAGSGLATTGFILGIIGTVLVILAIIWIFVLGGLALLPFLGGFSGAQ